MRLGSFYSGGKDSTFSISKAIEMGHKVVCLIIIHPLSADSMLFHYPNSWVTDYLATAMRIPFITTSIDNNSAENEFKSLDETVVDAKSIYDIEGIVHGGISSNFQRVAFKKICLRNKLSTLAPLWRIDPVAYMHQLINSNFEIKIVSVSAMGLDESWLGKSLDTNSINNLEFLSKKYGFNLTFEGGEAETLVVDCPIFHKKLQVKEAKIHWDGQRGIFEIVDAVLIPK